MRTLQATALSLFLAISVNTAQAEMMHKSSSSTVAATVENFTALLDSKGATVFAVVDHAAGAAKVDLELAPTTLVIFGNPKIGTPLMQAAPDMGLDLPLRVLFRDGADGQTEIVPMDLATIAAKHGVPSDHPALVKALKALDALTSAVAK